MKNITGPGGIHSLNSIGGSVVKLRAVPREHAIVAKRCSRKMAPISALERRERSQQVMLSQNPPWDVSARNEIIEVVEQRFYARVKVVQIDNDRDTSGPSPTCCYGRRGSIVPIYVKSAGVDDPLTLEFFWS